MTAKAVKPKSAGKPQESPSPEHVPFWRTPKGRAAGKHYGERCRAALRIVRQHPELLAELDAMTAKKA